MSWGEECPSHCLGCASTRARIGTRPTFFLHTTRTQQDANDSQAELQTLQLRLGELEKSAAELEYSNERHQEEQKERMECAVEAYERSIEVKRRQTPFFSPHKADLNPPS